MSTAAKAAASQAKRIHFHSSDDRFCGSQQQHRQFTFEPNDVTCRACMGRDTFVLSEQALAYVRQLEAAAV